jgi:hypothetical protein
MPAAFTGHFECRGTAPRTVPARPPRNAHVCRYGRPAKTTRRPKLARSQRFGLGLAAGDRALIFPHRESPSGRNSGNSRYSVTGKSNIRVGSTRFPRLANPGQPLANKALSAQTAAQNPSRKKFLQKPPFSVTQ